jgi:hypothetical protein
VSDCVEDSPYGVVVGASPVPVEVCVFDTGVVVVSPASNGPAPWVVVDVGLETGEEIGSTISGVIVSASKGLVTVVGVETGVTGGTTGGSSLPSVDVTSGDVLPEMIVERPIIIPLSDEVGSTSFVVGGPTSFVVGGRSSVVVA